MYSETPGMSAYAQVSGYCTRLGIDVPEPLAEAMTALRADNARAVATLEQLADAPARIAAALLTEADPFALDDVRADVARIALAAGRLQVGTAVEAQVDRRARAIIREHLPALVDALAREATRRGKHIAAARKALPEVDLIREDRAHVPAKHLTTWAVAREAVQAVPLIASVWTYAHEAATGRSLHRRDAALIVADVPTPTLDHLDRLSGSPAAHAAAQGLPLKVATLAEYDDRRKRVAADRAAEEQRRARLRDEQRNVAIASGI